MFRYFLIFIANFIVYILVFLLGMCYLIRCRHSYNLHRNDIYNYKCENLTVPAFI